MTQKILYFLPDEPDRYVISSPPGTTWHGKSIPIGRVLDMSQKLLFDPLPLISLGARDPWEEYTGDQSILPGLLKQVTEEHFPGFSDESQVSD